MIDLTGYSIEDKKTLGPFLFIGSDKLVFQTSHFPERFATLSILSLKSLAIEKSFSGRQPFSLIDEDNLAFTQIGFGNVTQVNQFTVSSGEITGLTPSVPVKVQDFKTSPDGTFIRVSGPFQKIVCTTHPKIRVKLN